MLNLFTVMILPALMLGIATFSLLAIILWLISSSFPGPVVPDEEDEIVGDGSTLRQEIL